MISVLLLVAFLHFVFFSYKQNVLACGLFGGSFNRPIDNNIVNKLKILGFINQSRGEDSCGYFNGADVYKGVELKKKFTDLVMKDGLIIPEESPNYVFLGHVRKASYGLTTERNAHPFIVDNELILAHNGTLTNHWPLCTKYDIDQKDIFVDSLALANLLYRKGPKILEEYKGTAALLMHRLSQPNILHAYHGASKEYQNGVEYEERPLFYLTQEEGVYVSSMKEALDYIKESKEDEAKTLPHNRIYSIKLGKFLKDYVQIERGDCNVKEVYKPTTTVPIGTQSSIFNNPGEVIKSLKAKFPNVYIMGEESKKPDAAKSYTKPNGIDITCETYPIEAHKEPSKDGYLFYKGGRFYVKNTDGTKLAEGCLFVYKKTGDIVENNSPLKANKSDRVEMLFFYKGAMIDGEAAYNKLKSIVDCPEDTKDNALITQKKNMCEEGSNFAVAVSHFSKYPVTLLPSESTKISTGRAFWYHKGRFAKSSYSPMFSSRDYCFVDGILTKIRSNAADDKPVITVVEGFKTTSQKKEAERYYDGIDDKEVRAIAERFKKKFSSEREAREEFGEVGVCAINFYAEDLLKEVACIKDPSEQLVKDKADDLLRTMIDEDKSFNDIMIPYLADIEQYIMDALVTISKEEDEENEEQGSDGEGVHDSVVDAFSKKKHLPLITDASFKALNTGIDMSEDSLLSKEAEDEIEKIRKTQEENDETKTILDEVADILSDLYKRATDLELLNNSRFASEAAFELTRGLDNVVNSMQNVCITCKENALGNKFKKINHII